jgi:hypothetical protein
MNQKKSRRATGWIRLQLALEIDKIYTSKTREICIQGRFKNVTPKAGKNAYL